MLLGITHVVSPHINRCELTHIEREPIDYERACRQHEAYRALLERCCASVVTLSDNIDHPDSCFVEDTAIVLDEIAIMASMGARSRRSEIEAIARTITRYRPIEYVKLPATIDGGDVVRAGKRLFVGLSTRTNVEGAEALRAIVEPYGYSVTTVGVRDSLHLRTSCSTIDDETLLINPHWIDPEPFGEMNIIRVDDNEPWAANSVRLGDTICMAAGAPRTTDLVARYAKCVWITDVSELRKAEGSLSCLALFIETGESDVKRARREQRAHTGYVAKATS